MWDLPGPGPEPTSPALAGGFLTTAPPVKSQGGFVKKNYLINYLLVWLRWVFLGAHRLFSSCSEQGLLFVVVRGLLIAVASRSTGSRRAGSVVVAHGL